MKTLVIVPHLSSSESSRRFFLGFPFLSSRFFCCCPHLCQPRLLREGPRGHPPSDPRPRHLIEESFVFCSIFYFSIPSVKSEAEIFIFPKILSEKIVFFLQVKRRGEVIPPHANRCRVVFSVLEVNTDFSITFLTTSFLCRQNVVFRR